VRDARRQRRFLAKVAGERDHPHRGIRRGQALHHGLGAVEAPVVDEEDFVVRPDGGDNRRADLGDRFVETLRFVVAGHDDRKTHSHRSP
jgi:hypothetical protein